jgi:hypothetical protein
MTRTQTCITVAALILAPSMLFGCDRTPTEAHNDGVEAQRKADESAESARKEAADKVAQANREVVEANDEARRKAAEAQANANEKIRDANRAITTNSAATNGDTETHSWAQQKLDSVDNLIDGVSAKAQTAAPEAKTKFNNAIEDVKRQRDVLQTEIAALETRSGDRLDKSKEQFAQRVDRIKDNIRNLEKSL